MNYLTKENLHPITLADATTVRSLLQKYPSLSCEANFSNLFMWQDIYDTLCADWENRLVIYNQLENALQMPLGEDLPPQQLAELVDNFCELFKHNVQIYDVSENYILKFRDLDKFFKIDYTEDNFDYIHLTERFCKLEGGKLRKKRNQIKQFTQDNPDFYLTSITPDNIAKVRALAEEINLLHPPCEFIPQENLALKKCFEHFFDPELQLDSCVLYAKKDLPVGFSIFSPTTAEVCDIHFEKALHSCRGAAQYLTYEVAQKVRPDYWLINREQDLGDLGLRQAKHALDPLLQYRRFALHRR